MSPPVLPSNSDMGIIRFITTTPNLCLLQLFLFSTICFLSISSVAANRITPGQVVRDGDTILSADERFALGFFSPGNSTLRYVGIWYNQIPGQLVSIWVANRETPISGGAGILTIGDDNNLVVLDGNGSSVWSTNLSIPSVNSTAMLMNNGNLIMSSSDRVGDVDRALWQSFSHPTDTFLPEMRVYMNDDQSGGNRTFLSWRSEDDPSPGRYSMGVDPREPPQIVIWDGPNRHWRSGHWNGLMFIGLPSIRAMFSYGFRILSDGNGQYFTYTPSNNSEILQFRILPSGVEEQLRWDEGRNNWSIIQSHPATDCDLYNWCGNFGKCNTMDRPICSCVEGYEPRDLDQWNRQNWSGGCVRRTPLECRRNGSVVEEGGGERDGFLRVDMVKLPDFVDSVGREDAEDCERRCLRNCSCNAYAFVNGINCMIWNGDLVDVQQFEEGAYSLYIRVAESELEGGNTRISRVVIIIIVVVVAFFLILSIWLLWRFRDKLKEFGNSRGKKKNELPIIDINRSQEFSTDFSGQSVEGQQPTGPEFVMFTFSSVVVATNNFSEDNKLGRGGFGLVYKGVLPGGQEVAVKRLSRRSTQGLEEFKNEITLIAKLQHRNLVRLFGCCIQGEEKMLIYEYMPNKSLDSILFDPMKQGLLDWKRRFLIIGEIARGILYLHRDSRLTIIHRDLKVSNILLDGEMNPKISDFGMARIFGGNENEASTRRVVGTYGYMAPEYAMEGLFSGKSDVYSFGVLLLEIISGRRNTSFRSAEYSNIVGYAWDLWDGGRAMELLDPSIMDSCNQNEVMRCIQVGMLCVQDLAVHRPNMSHVLLMLESENATLPRPKQPIFTSLRSLVDLEAWKEIQDQLSSNDVTLSTIVGR